MGERGGRHCLRSILSYIWLRYKSTYGTRTGGVEDIYPLPGDIMGLMEQYMPGNVLERCSTVLGEVGVDFHNLGGQVER